MPFEFNEKIKNLEPYSPVSGSYRIRLDANESFIVPGGEFQEDILRRVGEVAFNRYPDSAAEELCALFASYYGVNVAGVTAGNGSDELISVIFNAFLQKGDSVIVTEPDFSMYSFYAGLCEAKLIRLERTASFKIDVDLLIEKANETGARIIIFSNPCNPASTVVSRSEVERLVKSVNALVVLDEAYMDFCNESMIDSASAYDNLIVLRTCSKFAGMAGIRLGFAVAGRAISGVLKSVKSPYNVNSVSQAIGCAVFSNPKWLKNAAARICTSRDMLRSLLSEIEEAFPNEFRIVGSEANFIFCKCAKAEGVFEYLKTKGIIIRCFNGYLRISAGRNYENIEAAKAIESFFKGGDGQ